MNIDEWIDYDRLNEMCIDLVNSKDLVELFYPPLYDDVGLVFQLFDQPTGFNKSEALAIYEKIVKFLNHKHPKICVHVDFYNSQVRRHKGFITIKLLTRGTFKSRKNKFEDKRGLGKKTHKIFAEFSSRMVKAKK